nr:Chain M, guanine nucleotide-binding protein G(I)/G(S)/G(O) gamma-2 subunit [synthetic construct]1TNY_N Chain N, guanine nucleotide-binding protein G(I)/G(S)/G(O) gamma-2 subunit [synthetic construct]1TNY_O Chain O, guanine nucleotide-binding protein G(I)/G(S)/G(O) gamma-2 subunit [synthetic construct]1TNY_P Chain P, guanine nucleotide-binding protein G(I)/G(S)/G(O) gamma-2 subunit [synthetic construct]1TNY_Q Chain Q, guanine nucleotide-binding protein G(I)/G(S)/G(O) gamma-2 subunit [syntheti
FREKKFFCAIL